jgi:threonine/homoserine/homoserine lactone efflux protein
VQTSGEGAAASAGDAGDGLEDGVEAGTGERGEQATQQSWSSAFLGGTLVSLLNPKVILLFLALLPQFTREPGDSDLWPLWAQMGVLSAAHLLNCALVYVAVSAGFGRLLLHRPAARHWVSLASGAIMLILGLVVVIGELFA